MVTGVDLWNINAEEAVAYEYSRYNGNVTQLYDGTSPYKASDHNPEIVGLDIPLSGTEEIQVLGTNDFHGRLTNNSNAEAGAAVLAGAVKELRGENPKTVFAAAGDLIGASTFESFIQDDKPTIDALNEAGLEVSAVGNHEFDKGYRDLVERVMADYDAEDNPRGGAEWQYIGANVEEPESEDFIPDSWVRDFGDVQVGFVGAVTEDLPSLVSPAGIEEIQVTDIVEASNAAADDLEAEGADVIVLLVHEGAATTALADATNDSAFGQIVNGVDSNIDAIVSGHTHLAYNHAITVPEWVAEGRDVTTRPVVSAGQYGTNLNQLVFTVDEVTGEVQAKTQEILNLESCTANCAPGQTPVFTENYDPDPATATIVQAAVAAANELGAVRLGDVGGEFRRAVLPGVITGDFRGGESTLGNLVAEVQRWATDTPETGNAQIAFMNPGGLRAEMTGTGTGAFPRELSYRGAANVQPFANTLVNMDMTGANIKLALEQQWQRDSAGNIPSRPFLRLGVSNGFVYTHDPARAEGDRITGMWLDGVPIDTAATYSVTVNSFLASGGDNFGAFTNGTDKRDTGKIDLEAMVDYMAEFGSDQPLEVDYSQHAVGVSPSGEPAPTYAPGDEVSFDVSSWSLYNGTDRKDTQVVVSVDGAELGRFDLDNLLPGPEEPNPAEELWDEVGKTSVTVTLPDDVPAGPLTLTLTGENTGTEIPVIIQVEEEDTTVDADITVDHRPNRVFANSTRPYLDIDVTADGVTPTGRVEVRQNGALLRAG
ncbi:MAG TPA: 5'-nucleotidase C-terminal domain-containing protein, partial [Acidimicrobiia bacterium]|nr:5'-nucleotidase C-terminal domain-containing protein [Acidimicrobiia bacterium]